MIDLNSSSSYASHGYPRLPSQGRNTGGDSNANTPFSQTDTSTKGKKGHEDNFANPQKLDEAEQKQVEELKKRDAEVRAQEQAHMAAAGSLARGGPTYVFQTGPDGRQYAIGGSVKIDTSPGKTPEETARKAQQILAAAHAPADPSGQDLKVAAASSMETEAAHKTAEKSEKNTEKPGTVQNEESAEANGATTTARQAFASFPIDRPQSPKYEEADKQTQNVYLKQAAKAYRKYA